MEKEQHRFNLELHLLAWKRGFGTTSLSRNDIEELAQHMSDHFAELIAAGHSETEAWNIALHAIGTHRAIVAEFSKVWYMFLKNSTIYYTLAFIPGILLFFFTRDQPVFLWAVGTYLLFYRTCIDYLRLRSRNAIEKNGFWRLLLPGGHIRYFRKLYY